MITADEGKNEVLLAIFAEDCGSLIAGTYFRLHSLSAL